MEIMGVLTSTAGRPTERTLMREVGPSKDDRTSRRRYKRARRASAEGEGVCPETNGQRAHSPGHRALAAAGKASRCPSPPTPVLTQFRGRRGCAELSSPHHRNAPNHHRDDDEHQRCRASRRAPFPRLARVLHHGSLATLAKRGSSAATGGQIDAWPKYTQTRCGALLQPFLWSIGFGCFAPSSLSIRGGGAKFVWG